MKVFPSSDQKCDDTSLVKHAHCDFETSLRIKIRHDSDNERESCPSNKTTLFELFFKISKRKSAPSAPLLTLAMLESENRRITQKESCVLLEFCTLRRALSQRGKKEKCAGRLHPRIHVLVEYHSRGEERPHGASSFKPSCQPHVCVILFLSYIILGLLVSPRSQQELRSCGVAIERGLHESSGAILQT